MNCMQPFSLSLKFQQSGWTLLAALCPSSALQLGLLSQLQMTHAVPGWKSVPAQQVFKKITKGGWDRKKNNSCKCWTPHAEAVRYAVHHPKVVTLHNKHCELFLFLCCIQILKYLHFRRYSSINKESAVLSAFCYLTWPHFFLQSMIS